MRHKVAVHNDLTCLWMMGGSTSYPKWQLRAAVEQWLRENVRGPVKLSCRREKRKGLTHYIPLVCFGRMKEAVLFKLAWC
jgi:hypothetical protein